MQHKLALILLLGVLACAALPRITPHAGAQEACRLQSETGELNLAGYVPATQGAIRIPELGLSSSVASNGCFAFRDIRLPRSPMLVSIVIDVPGYRPATWANYIVLDAGGGPFFTPELHPGTEPEVIDPCPDLIAHPQTQSAAVQRHASLCAQLPNAGTATGVRSAPRTESLLLLIGGITLLCAGAAAYRSRRSS